LLNPYPFNLPKEEDNSAEKQPDVESRHISAATMAGCARRDPESQRQVYEAIHKKMYSICLRYVPQADEARDLLHDGFIKLFDKLAAGPSVQNPEAWIRRLFVNFCLDYVRSAYKKYIVYGDDTLLHSRALDEPESSADDWMAQFDTRKVLKAMSELRPDQRVILNLYAVDGLSHAEIAAALQIPEATSRSRLMRARASLKSKLQYR